MGTLSHPLTSLTLAYPHPSLPSTSYILTRSFTPTVKRTLGSAVVIESTVAAGELREVMRGQWEKLWGVIRDRRWGRGREIVKRLEGVLEGWIGRGRDVDEEFVEMKVDVMR